jgi:hypothetical protein
MNKFIKEILKEFDEEFPDEEWIDQYFYTRRDKPLDYGRDEIREFIQKKLEKQDKIWRNILKKGKKAYIQGNVISFEKPKYKSMFFDIEEVLILEKYKNE